MITTIMTMTGTITTIMTATTIITTITRTPPTSMT